MFRDDNSQSKRKLRLSLALAVYGATILVFWYDFRMTSTTPSMLIMSSIAFPTTFTSLFLVRGQPRTDIAIGPLALSGTSLFHIPYSLYQASLLSR